MAGMSEADKARMAKASKAMEDPEIQAILSDPTMRQVLQDVGNPNSLKKHSKNLSIKTKIDKLVAAGVVQM